MILSWSDARPARRRGAVLGELFVGLTHALRDQLRGLSRRDADAAAAEQRRREREFGGHGAPLGQTLRPSDDGLPNGVDEIGAAQFALGAETGDDDRLRPRQLPGIVGIGGDVHEDLMGPGSRGIKTALKRRLIAPPTARSITASVPVRRRRAVMADQQWLGDVGEVAVHRR